MKNYYNKKYFKWQKKIGEFGGRANMIKFQKFIKPGDVVVDFGCGGGHLLGEVNCKVKYGIEIGKEAAKSAKMKGIVVVSSAGKLKDGVFNVVISNNALEHAEEPLAILRTLYKKLKKGGIIVFVVPSESFAISYKKDDINQHLYSWSPQSLGNIFTLAGFSVIESKPFYHKWPPFYEFWEKLLGMRIFHLLCFAWGRIDKRSTQLRVVARKS